MSPAPQLTQSEAGEIGMRRAVMRADSVTPSWSDTAAQYVAGYARTHRDTMFLAEEIREWAEGQGCPVPPDGRAWGHVIKTAATRKVILSTGLARKVQLSGHNSRWGPLWRAGEAK